MPQSRYDPNWGWHVVEVETPNWKYMTSSSAAVVRLDNSRVFIDMSQPWTRCEYCGSKQNHQRMTCTQCGTLL
jgi:hypothetical protein